MLTKIFNKKSDDLNSPLDINIPKHIAIIMDGNGRWAKKRNLPRNLGHSAGVKTIKKVIQQCQTVGVEYLTIYAFSTENWNRPKAEVATLMDLLVVFLKKELNEMHEKNCKITTIGDISILPEKSKAEMLNAIKVTENNTGLHLSIALNYGSRAEIISATKEIASKVLSKELSIEDINEELFSNHLDTKDIPDPDLLIRTSGELRLSNYLLWQLAYTEFYFCDVYWPDFDEAELNKAIKVYSNRNRRFGKV